MPVSPITLSSYVTQLWPTRNRGKADYRSDSIRFFETARIAGSYLNLHTRRLSLLERNRLRAYRQKWLNMAEKCRRIADSSKVPNVSWGAGNHKLWAVSRFRAQLTLSNFLFYFKYPDPYIIGKYKYQAKKRYYDRLKYIPKNYKPREINL